jgi:hypothetical protein
MAGQLGPEIHFSMPPTLFWAEDLDGDHKAEA